MSKSRFPYVVLAAMLIAEFAVQGAETTRGAKAGQTVGSAHASRGDGFASGMGVSEQRSCNVDIAMTKGLVSEVSYSGSPGGLQ